MAAKSEPRNQDAFGRAKRDIARPKANQETKSFGFFLF
jgi:hypothetical protein